MFHTFRQNNSGGYFIENEDVQQYVIIEYDTLEELRDKATRIFAPYMEYCSCCGERWPLWVLEDEEDLDNSSIPQIFGKTVPEFFEANLHKTFTSEIILYSKNGRRDHITKEGNSWDYPKLPENPTVKRLYLEDDTNQWNETSYESIYDGDSEQLLFSVHNLCECPEDAIIGRDLFVASDYLEAIRYGMILAKQGYTNIELIKRESEEK